MPGDDVDHVLRRELDLSAVRFPLGDPEPNPFIRFRAFLHAYHVAIAGGLSDEEFCSTRAAARPAGGAPSTGTASRSRPSPAATSSATSSASRRGAASGSRTRRGTSPARTRPGTCSACCSTSRWPSGSGWPTRSRRPDLAIASCGNAALAAAVVAAAGGRTLHVFVPVDAEPAVLARLEELGAHVTVCPREPRGRRRSDGSAAPAGDRGGRAPVHLPGEPERARRRGRRDARLRDRGRPRRRRHDRRPPRRAGRRRCARERVRRGAAGGCRARRRSPRRPASTRCRPRVPGRCGAPSTPSSPVARAPTPDDDPQRARATRLTTARSSCGRGRASPTASPTASSTTRPTTGWRVVEGMLATGGGPLVVDEETLAEANALALETTADPGRPHRLRRPRRPARPARRPGRVSADERVAVLFTGAIRPHTPTGRNRDEELSRARHPVAQGL